MFQKPGKSFFFVWGEFLMGGNGFETLLWLGLSIRSGPQSKKWSDQKITLNPTGFIHKKATFQDPIWVPEVC